MQTGLLECDQQFQLDVYPEQQPSFQFRVLESGWLWVPEYNAEYRPEHYCLETFVSDASDSGSPFIMGGAVCVVQEEPPHTFDPTKIPIRKCCTMDMVRICYNRICYTQDAVTIYLCRAQNYYEHFYFKSFLSLEYVESNSIISHMFLAMSYSGNSLCLLIFYMGFTLPPPRLTPLTTTTPTGIPPRPVLVRAST